MDDYNVYEKGGFECRPTNLKPNRAYTVNFYLNVMASIVFISSILWKNIISIICDIYSLLSNITELGNFRWSDDFFLRFKPTKWQPWRRAFDIIHIIYMHIPTP